MYIDKTEPKSIEDFPGGWHKQITKNHICIWSDEWMVKHSKQLEKEKKNDPSPNNTQLLHHPRLHSFSKHFL